MPLTNLAVPNNCIHRRIALGVLKIECSGNTPNAGRLRGVSI
jgi:hypothetical protein